MFSQQGINYLALGTDRRAVLVALAALPAINAIARGRSRTQRLQQGASSSINSDMGNLLNTFIDFLTVTKHSE